MSTKNETSIQIPRAVLELWRFVSKDLSRCNLTHVRLASTDDASYPHLAEATNGHVAVQVRWGNTFDGPKLTEECFFDADVLKRAIKLGGEAHIVIQGETYALTAGPEGSIPLANPAKAQMWPDFAQVWPPYSKPPKVDVGLDPTYVELVMSHARKHVLGKGCAVQLKMSHWAHDGLGPCLFGAATSEISASYVIMPMRL